MRRINLYEPIYDDDILDGLSEMKNFSFAKYDKQKPNCKDEDTKEDALEKLKVRQMAKEEVIKKL